MERENNTRKMTFNGVSAFTEKCLDQHHVNWFVAATANFFPQLKKIFIDDKDEDLFHKLDTVDLVDVSEGMLAYTQEKVTQKHAFCMYVTYT